MVNPYHYAINYLVAVFNCKHTDKNQPHIVIKHHAIGIPSLICFREPDPAYRHCN